MDPGTEGWKGKASTNALKLYVNIHLCKCGDLLVSADSQSGSPFPNGKDLGILNGNDPDSTKNVWEIKYSEKSSKC